MDRLKDLRIGHTTVPYKPAGLDGGVGEPYFPVMARTRWNLGDRLREARGETTQEKAARDCRVNPTALSHWELNRREPSCTNLRRLARGLRVSADWLLGLEA